MALILIHIAVSGQSTRHIMVYYISLIVRTCDARLPSADHPGRSAKTREGNGYKQEQGECAIPVRRVAVRSPDGGKIDDWAAVQVLAGNAD